MREGGEKTSCLCQFGRLLTNVNEEERCECLSVTIDDFFTNGRIATVSDFHLLWSHLFYICIYIYLHIKISFI